MEDIILKECMNEPLSEAEKLQLRRWLSNSAANRRMYHQIRLSVMQTASIQNEEVKEEVWAELNARMEGAEKQMKPKQVVWPVLLKIAAVFLVILSVLLYLDEEEAPQVQEPIAIKLIEKMSMPGQKVTTYLPDGTMVKLNADSRLIVPEQFSADTREVTLYGEAFFDVKRDETKPFIIHTKDVDVQVLGTSFNVRAYQEQTQSVVAVATGKVAVSKSESTTYLTPGERVVYEDQQGLGSIEAFDSEAEFGWRDNLLLLNDKNLDEILTQLSRWYGVNFELQSTKIKTQKRFSGKYKDPSLKMVLEGLSYVYHFEYSINNKTVILK